MNYMSMLPLHMTEVTMIWAAGGGYVLAFALLSEVFLRWQERRKLLPDDGLANVFFFFLIYPGVESLIGIAAVAAVLLAAYQLTPLHVPITLWTFPLYFLAGDFSFYCSHRLSHEIRLFWCDHSIHHSSPEYDFSTNLRSTPFMWLIRMLAYLPAVSLGFHPVLLAYLAMNASAFQTLCHTQRLGRFAPWFEKIFVTPSNHIVHHACNPEYLDKNYGGLLGIWDHLLGTYQPLLDDVPPIFGVTKPVNSSNPLKILTYEFKNTWRDFFAAPSWKLKLGVLFGHPGQTFEASAASSPTSNRSLDLK